MAQDISRLLSLPIRWRKAGPTSWEAEAEGETIALRMNNFPEEPLYTLTTNAQSLDIDDAPPDWEIPRS